MNILIAGGAGFTGGVICDCLLKRGHNPIIIDSLRHGRGSACAPSDVKLYEGDIADYKLVKQIFDENSDIDICIHCAEISALITSTTEPYAYYYGNVVKSMDFFKYLNDFGCNRIIFCSSSTVYDIAPGHVVTENSPVEPRSPFGRAKYMAEIILKDFCRAYNMRGIIFRSFNAIGAGEIPRGATRADATRPNSILRNLLRVMDGDLPHFEIAGDDWDTRDGTCIRDYIHVLDIARAHVNAVDNFDGISGDSEFSIINIGNGFGVTVKEFISAFENVTGEKIKTITTKRRPGDSAGVYANIKKAEQILRWKPELPVEEAILSVLALPR